MSGVEEEREPKEVCPKWWASSPGTFLFKGTPELLPKDYFGFKVSKGLWANFSLPSWGVGKKWGGTFLLFTTGGSPLGTWTHLDLSPQRRFLSQNSNFLIYRVSRYSSSSGLLRMLMMGEHFMGEPPIYAGSLLFLSPASLVKHGIEAQGCTYRIEVKFLKGGTLVIRNPFLSKDLDWKEEFTSRAGNSLYGFSSLKAPPFRPGSQRGSQRFLKAL